jgi:hypothetical protein
MNSATRIYKIFEKLKPPVHNAHTLSDSICIIFNFTSKDITDKNHFALSKLIMIRNEIVLASEKIKNSNKIQPIRYEETFKRIYAILNSEILNQDWGNSFNSLPQGFFNVIGICADLIDNEEEEISEKEFEEIWREIKEWRKVIEEGEYSYEIKKFLIRSIEIIENGLRDYLIIGVQAFKDSIYQTHLHFMQNTEIVKTETNKDTMQKLKFLWGKIINISNKASNTIKLIETASKIIEYSKDAFNING